MKFVDTETCGFHGPIVLIQWAEDDGPIHLHNVWHTPVKETMQLIEHITDGAKGVCLFNATFDWFHLCQMYTTMMLLDPNEEPDIQKYAFAEKEGRDGPCLKPKHVIDLMLHARKGKFQSMMDRKDIRVKKVPTQLAYPLADELTKRIPMENIYFAKKSDPSVRWQVADIKDDFDDIIPDFKDIVLRFAPSSALKALAVEALGYSSVLLMKDIGVPDRYRPIEYGFAPFALSGIFNDDGSWEAVGPHNWWLKKWPTVIKEHISHWGYNEQARQYATDDVTYTRELYQYFDKPAVDDDDSVLAAMVGAVRWHGLAVDIDRIKDERERALSLFKKAKKIFNPNAPDICKKYLYQVLSQDERIVVTSTEKRVLEEVMTWRESQVCHCGMMDLDCKDCHGSGLIKSARETRPHPAAERAREIIEARRAKKKVELFDKIIAAGRFHPSFEVIGALSSRMSGSGGDLNAQGINHERTVRSCFTLGWDGYPACGGDFDSFEVSIFDGAYSDPVLHAELIKGKKLQGLWGEFFFPGKSYDEILATDDLPGEQNLYVRSKNGTYAILYMGEGYTLHNRVGIPEETANEAFQRIITKYNVFAQKRREYMDRFASMRQPNGIGTKVEWHEPDDYIETLFGFRRYFTLENRICKALFELADDPPDDWQRMNLKVTRRERVQTACGAVRSALFASAFALQAANMRAAGNHVIQGTGAQLTKKLQVNLWGIQESGIHDWAILPVNIHDEVMTATREDKVEDTSGIVDDFVKEYRSMIPLLGVTWKKRIKSWGEK